MEEDGTASRDADEGLLRGVGENDIDSSGAAIQASTTPVWIGP